MVYESGNIVTVNYVVTVGQAEQIGARGAVVDGIGLVVGQARPRVLDNNVLPADWRGGVNTIAMNLGSPDNESHRRAVPQEAMVNIYNAPSNRIPVLQQGTNGQELKGLGAADSQREMSRTLQGNWKHDDLMNDAIENMTTPLQLSGCKMDEAYKQSVGS